jgi:hypothetical protein
MSSVSELLSDAVGRWTLVPDRSRFVFRNNTMWDAMTVKGQFAEIRGEGQVTEAGAVSGRIDLHADIVIKGAPLNKHSLRWSGARGLCGEIVCGKRSVRRIGSQSARDERGSLITERYPTPRRLHRVCNGRRSPESQAAPRRRKR